jgi:flavin reductase (DIM6/NTAB) family NADH-FMN oxidoreductase RutF
MTMSERIAIRPADLNLDIHSAWNDDWFLLASGDFESSAYNAMTVAWGSHGIMWGRPFVMVVVRPTRYTYEFMEKYADFTLSVLGPAHRSALDLCGSKSGRDMDKIAASGLTPTPSQRVRSPVFLEAELVFECRTVYWQDFDPAHFKDPAIDANYPDKDYHRMYFGEVLHLEGLKSYLRSGTRE